MAVAGHVHRQAVDAGGEVGAMVEVEAAQEVLVGLAVTRVLGDDDPRHEFQHLARAQRGAGGQQFGTDHALRRGVGTAHAVVVVAAGDLDLGGGGGRRGRGRCGLRQQRAGRGQQRRQRGGGAQPLGWPRAAAAGHGTQPRGRRERGHVADPGRSACPEMPGGRTRAGRRARQARPDRAARRRRREGAGRQTRSGPWRVFRRAQTGVLPKRLVATGPAGRGRSCCRTAQRRCQAQRLQQAACQAVAPWIGAGAGNVHHHHAGVLRRVVVAGQRAMVVAVAGVMQHRPGMAGRQGAARLHALAPGLQPVHQPEGVGRLWRHLGRRVRLPAARAAPAPAAGASARHPATGAARRLAPAAANPAPAAPAGRGAATGGLSGGGRASWAIVAAPGDRRMKWPIGCSCGRPGISHRACP